MVEKKRAGFGVRTKRYWARSWQLYDAVSVMLYIFVFWLCTDVRSTACIS